MQAEAFRKFRELADEFEATAGSLPIAQRVLMLGRLQDALRELVKATIYPETKPARQRLLRYFRENVGRTIDSSELEIVSGIKDYPRRIRELRVEDGWPIESGAQPRELSVGPGEESPISGHFIEKLKPDQYVLLEDAQDHDAARRWRIANEIRRSTLSTKEKLLKYFRLNVGTNLKAEELRYVANNNSDWARRTRELRTEDGWPIVTNFSGDPSMPLGTHKLAEDRQSETHDRHISEIVRREVLRRDGGQCQWEGCGWPVGFPVSDKRFLEVHHIVHHAEGGPNTTENLVTLCNIHHDEAHRSAGVLRLAHRNA